MILEKKKIDKSSIIWEEVKDKIKVTDGEIGFGKELLLPWDSIDDSSCLEKNLGSSQPHDLYSPD